MDIPAAPPIPTAVREQAAQWWVELQSDEASEDMRCRCRAWRSAHADHERAWQRLEALGGRLQQVPSAIAHATLAPAAQPGRRHAAKALAVALLAGGAIWMLEDEVPWRAGSAGRRTGRGETASLRLPDGTQLQMNAQSAIDVRFGSTERVVRLLRGEILIATAHDAAMPARPFIVETGQGRIRALGTRFLVRDRDEPAGSRVAVFEGAVELRPRRAAAAARVVPAGWQGRLQADVARVTDAADEARTSWTQGMLVAQDMPLAEVVAELALHRPGWLVCDPAVAALKVSGTYPLADTDRVLRILATTLPIELETRTRYWLAVRPAHRPG